MHGNLAKARKTSEKLQKSDAAGQGRGQGGWMIVPVQPAAFQSGGRRLLIGTA
jgi:hypothetical protein